MKILRKAIYRRCWKQPPSAYRQSLVRFNTFFVTLSIFCAAAQKWNSKGFRSGLCAGQMISVPLLITRPWKFSVKYCLASFVQCGETPSCILHSLRRVAVARKVGHTLSWSKARQQEPSTEARRPSSQLLCLSPFGLLGYHLLANYRLTFFELLTATRHLESF